MTEPVASGKPRQFPCSKCGADAEYVPQVGLKCPYCGHNAGIPQNEDQCIEELSFDEFTNRVSRGYADKDPKDIKCGQCGAMSHISGDQASLRCAFCGVPMVLEETIDDGVIRPEAVVPFEIPKQMAAEKFNAWIHGLWFAPNELKRLQELDRFVGVYRPYWTYDSATHSWYRGQRGVYYYTTETYTTRENGRTVTRTRQVRHTRWYSVSGQVDAFFDDVLVGGGRELEWNTTFNLGGLEPYDPGFLAGWQAEKYGISLEQGWTTARVEIDGRIQTLVVKDIGGDEQRVESVRTSYNAVRFKHILLPIWLASYFYQGKTFRVQVNGQSGEVHGNRPYSFWKIFFLVVVILGVIGAIIAAFAIANSNSNSNSSPADGHYRSHRFR